MKGIFGIAHPPNSRHQRHRTAQITRIMGTPSSENVYQNKRIEFLNTQGIEHLSDGSVLVSLWGELLNLSILNQELISYGYHSTNKPEEIITRAYNVWGEECLRHFEGLFTLFIYDLKDEVILIANSITSVYPIYWTYPSNKLLFSSSLKALLRSGYIASELNLEAVAHFLYFGSCGHEMTLINEVHSLPSGHYLSYNLRNEELQVRSYQNLASYFTLSPPIKTQEELIHHIKSSQKPIQITGQVPSRESKYCLYTQAVWWLEQPSATCLDHYLPSLYKPTLSYIAEVSQSCLDYYFSKESRNLISSFKNVATSHKFPKWIDYFLTGLYLKMPNSLIFKDFRKIYRKHLLGSACPVSSVMDHLANFHQEELEKKFPAISSHFNPLAYFFYTMKKSYTRHMNREDLATWMVLKHRLPLNDCYPLRLLTPYTDELPYLPHLDPKVLTYCISHREDYPFEKISLKEIIAKDEPPLSHELPPHMSPQQKISKIQEIKQLLPLLKSGILVDENIVSHQLIDQYFIKMNQVKPSEHLINQSQSLISLELWLRLFFDRSIKNYPPEESIFQILSE